MFTGARDHTMESEIQEILDVPEARDHSMESEIPETIRVEKPREGPVCLQEFELYATRSYFYMIGHDESGAVQRVLKISRSEPSGLDIIEDSTTYSKVDCDELLQRIHHGNLSTGGLEFVTVCYGIVGFVKFLGPYYMLLITERREIGVICGHSIYAITGSKLISVPSSTVQSAMAYSKNENRYKKLFCAVDLSKGFFFSYSYHVMNSIQRNMSDHTAGQTLYETMYVWNESMTRGIRNQLQNTLWTVALVYGFFKQVKLQISGKDIYLTLIARRSRHYAGTRFLKRGVNEEGHVANDVETEQIVIKDVPDGCACISSVVQHRGSIPLFWSQHTSRFNMKPDIILSKKDAEYQATKLHFENLAKRYGLPIIILNLIKTRERRPRESILCKEFKNAINSINSEISEENRLKFLHWDISKYCKSKTTNVLSILAKMTACALNLTGIFFCQVQPSSRRKESFDCLPSENSERKNCTTKECCNLDAVCRGADDVAESNILKLSFQNGILRTNCIDCLDRTNVAQFAYGLVAFGRQLQTLGLQHLPSIDLDTSPTNDLLRLYEMMGDAVAFQYGGSAAHNKIFCQRRGQCKAATRSQEIFRSLQRYYSNAYLDAEKQDAINVFLGHFQLHQEKPELWVMDSDQNNVENRSSKFSEENSRSAIKRSLSDGICLSESKSPVENASVSKHDKIIPVFPDKMQDNIKVHSESAPEILTCKRQASYCRQLFPNIHPEEELFCCSNFLDIEWHSSSGNSWEEELSTLAKSPDFKLKSDSVIDELKVVANTCQCGCSMQGNGMNEDLNNDATHSLSIPTDFPSSFARLMQRCCSL
ncbi:phosphoinositide phosphatase SAC2-like [Apium graveolens]|uniref:phosphoinositide phosphatase SAC2-like n=1 Tax=Apium graveolens TaxID=4045 RepID=UPI003D79EA86